MRRIERTSQFKRDYKREAKGQHRATLEADLVPVVRMLASDDPLPPRLLASTTTPLLVLGKIIAIAM